MNYVDGDLIALALEGRFDVIAHGCNCHNTMKSGIAVPIRDTFPAAWEADQATSPGDRTKLGTCTQAHVTTPSGALTVINAYTQYDYGTHKRQVDYDAVASCMAWIKQNHSGTRIGLPKIGAGLAGGDWQKIEAIIDQELVNEDVTVVNFVPK